MLERVRNPESQVLGHAQTETQPRPMSLARREREGRPMSLCVRGRIQPVKRSWTTHLEPPDVKRRLKSQ
uniref:Uncharacterized protein n=1 Tax=Peronospora matthiolae TaxID=2874970 RepID=A0AAV1T8Q5_9STRA